MVVIVKVVRMPMKSFNCNSVNETPGDDDFARPDDDEISKNDGYVDGETDKKDVIKYRLENDEYDSFAVDSKTGLYSGFYSTLLLSL